MQGDFLFQNFGGMFESASAYKNIGQVQQVTASDHLSTINAAGGNWTSPEFYALHGQMLGMTNDAVAEGEGHCNRGAGLDTVTELGMSCSSQVEGIVSSL